MGASVWAELPCETRCYIIQLGCFFYMKKLFSVYSQSLPIFELFSVMVHSGSAAGGHYYACIKSFSDGQWYSFNDQHVSKVSLSTRVTGLLSLSYLHVCENDSGGGMYLCLVVTKPSIVSMSLKPFTCCKHGPGRLVRFRVIC